MSKSRLFSGKIKKKTGTALDGSRYEYLDISQAEPDLGIPSFDNAILIANTSGQRFWSHTITNVTLAGTVISSGTVTGDLLPSITNTFNLGSADLRFKTLYVSSATLDIGGVTISSSGTDSLNISKLIVSTATNSTSTVSGALQVVGGVGIGLDLFVGGAISATSLTIGNISNNQGTLNIQSGLASTSTNSGALQVVGGVGIGGNLYVGGEIVAEKLTIQYTTVTTTLIETDDIITTKNTTVSTSTNSGALQVAGGVGVGGDLWVGSSVDVFGNLTIAGKIITINTETDALQVLGGILAQGPVEVSGLIYSSGSQVLTYDSTQTLLVSNALFATTSGYALAFNTGTVVTNAINATTASFATTSGYALAFNTNTVVTTAINASFATTSGYALAFNTNTVVTTAINASFATTSGYALAFNTNTVVTTAVNINGGAAGGVVYQASTSTTSILPIGNEGTVLTVNSGTLTWTAASGVTAGFATTASYASTATGLGPEVIYIVNNTVSTSTNSGALVVSGGVGIGNDLQVGGKIYAADFIYSNGQQVVTTATINDYATQTIISAGTDTAVSTSTGNVIIWNTSNLQTVTDRGNTTTNAISITNTTTSDSTITGALIVAGGVGIRGNVYIGNNLYVANTAYLNNAEILTTSSGFSSESGVSVINQRLFVNTTTNSTSTTTGAITTPGGVGIGKDLWAGGKIYAGDFIYSNGQQVITTATINDYANQTTIVAGTDTAVSTSTGNITIWNTSTLQTVTDRGQTTTNAISISNATVSDSTTTGALTVAGGVGIGGSLYVAGEIVAQKLTIEYTTVTTTIVETDDIIKTYNTTTSINANSGALQVAGGVGVGQNVYVGGQVITSVVTSTGGLSINAGPGGGNFLTISNNGFNTVFNPGGTIQPGGAIIGSTYGGTSVDVTQNVLLLKSLYYGAQIITAPDGTTTQTWSFGTDGQLTNPGKLIVQSAEAATSKVSGALQVSGGAGISGDLYASDVYSNGQKVVTTATINNFANQTTITAGTDTAVSTSTGDIVIWNTSNLQSVTDRGHTTTNQIRINNTLTSTSSFSSNALYVTGGIGGDSGFNINGDGYLHGDLTVYGKITGTNITLNVLSANSATFYGDATGANALYAGVLGYTPLPQTIFQATGDLNNYMEMNIQNINSGPMASSEIVASADNTTEAGAYIDMGITSSNWDGSAPFSLGTALGPNDGFLYVGQNSSGGTHPGDLVLGTTTDGTQIKFVIAATGTVTANDIAIVMYPKATESVNTETGTLVVKGGLGVDGAIHAATTSYINNSKILVAGDLETVTHTATYITNNPGTVAGLTTIANTTTVYGTYDFGTVSDVWTFNDYNTGTNTGYYSIHDATGAPAFIVYIGFSGITDFNRIVLNINYTQNSGHTQTIDLYNYVQSQWVTFTTYSGSAGWFEFILGTIDSAPYISSGNVTARINHISSGNTAHRTWIDYIALEKSIQGGQGPRGATGATGATGAQGLTTSTTSTFNFYSTESSVSTITGAVRVVGGVGIGGDLYIGGALYQSGQQVITTATINNFANQTTIVAGTDTAVSTSTGNITIWNTSTLQSVTNRGNVTTNTISITNVTGSTSTTTGALQVAGGVGVGGSVYVGNRVGFVNTAGNASVAYQFYNTVTNTIDMVWG